MSKLTDFVLKRLQENIKQRWVIESKMFFDLLENMGIINDEELLTDIFEFLENEIESSFPLKRWIPPKTC